MQTRNLLGIDVGASGIKGALVNIETGEFVGERFRVPMPDPSTPENAANAIAEIVKNFNYQGKIGIGFPSVVKKGIALTAANLHPSWIGCNIETVVNAATGCPVIALNDADAAGMAEMRFGKGKDKMGTVVLITIGTGLGSAVFTDGHLLRNTEFGHILMKTDLIAEKYAADSIRKKEELSWKKWGKRFNEYLQKLDLYLQPSLILLGGGSSKYFDEFKGKITIETPVEPATLLNSAGIIGAAVYAAESE
ncbi:MAG: ROK family protein [Saprospiraceae bacterium]|nr:ROK family protein [Saprospiraceae bacterium]